MRNFVDDAGRLWDVTVGKESYGNLVLLFAARSTHAVRKAGMDANSLIAAERELRDLDEPALRERLARAEDWA